MPDEAEKEIAALEGALRTKVLSVRARAAYEAQLAALRAGERDPQADGDAPNELGTV